MNKDNNDMVTRLKSWKRKLYLPTIPISWRQCHWVAETLTSEGCAFFIQGEVHKD